MIDGFLFRWPFIRISFLSYKRPQSVVIGDVFFYNLD